MKAGPVLALAIVTSAVVSTAVAWIALDPSDDSSSINARTSMEARLSRSRQRIGELEDELAALREAHGRLERLVAAQNETLQLTRGLQEELLDVRMELAGMRSKLEEAQPLAALAAGRSESPEDFQVLLEETLKEAVDSRVRKTTRAEQLRAFQPFIRAGFRREMGRIAKKLDLNEDQKRRFEKTLGKAFDETMPLVTVMMDTSRSKEERAQAYEDVQATYDEVNAEAASFLDPEQKETFDELQDESRDGMERLRDMIESGQSPLIPGGLPAPPASGGEDL